MDNEKTYEIGELKYRLLGPCFGVQLHISSVLAELDASLTTLEDAEISSVLGSRAVYFAAGLICPEGVSPQDRDLDRIASDLEWCADPSLVPEIIVDFFEQPGHTPANATGGAQAVAILGSMVRVRRATAGAMNGVPSSELSSCSPAETSSGETESSGDSAGTTAEIISE